MSRLPVLFLLCSLLASLAWGCQPPDCDKEDCGSCANACCNIEFLFAESGTIVFNEIVTSLKAKGADGRYMFVNSSDYRSAKLPSGIQYMIQGVHSTLVHHYNDTLDFLLLSKSSASTTVRAFSISRIEGALCDAGQNYKNLVGFIKGLGQDFKQTVIFGCTKTYDAPAPLYDAGRIGWGLV